MFTNSLPSEGAVRMLKSSLNLAMHDNMMHSIKQAVLNGY